MKNLFELIKTDRIQALKNKEKVKLNLLSCLISDATKMNKNPSSEVVIATIKKFIKGAEEVMKYAIENSDTHIQASVELDILSEYLPKQLDKSEIKRYIIQNGFKNIGETQKWFKENYSGRFDGKIVSEIFKEIC